MADLPRTPNTGLALFALAALLTFGFSTLLQFTPRPWFFGALIAMHCGIALFIISKRLFKNCTYIVARYYRFEYLLLVPYLLIMAYAFASKANIVPLFETEKSIVTLAYTFTGLVLTIWNFQRMRKDVLNQQDEVLASRKALGAF